MSFNWNTDWNDRDEITIDAMKPMASYYTDNQPLVNL